MSTTKETLEAAFHEDMLKILEKERELDLHSNRFQQMVYELGGVQTAHELLKANRTFPPGTFGFLRVRQRLDLTLEHYVLLEKYYPLFTGEEREIARFRLEVED